DRGHAGVDIGAQLVAQVVRLHAQVDAGAAEQRGEHVGRDRVAAARLRSLLHLDRGLGLRRDLDAPLVRLVAVAPDLDLVRALGDAAQARAGLAQHLAVDEDLRVLDAHAGDRELADRRALERRLDRLGLARG